MSKLTGLPVSVYRNDLGDSTNGGVTGQHNNFILVSFMGEPVEGPFEADNNKPGSLALAIVAGPLGHPTAVMANDETGAEIKLEGEIGPMFGGNFIYTSDSRFPLDYPVKVHDRYETQELYDQLSR
jgi:hypothetical protein